MVVSADADNDRQAHCWVMETANPRERMLAGVGATTRVLEIDGLATAVTAGW